MDTITISDFSNEAASRAKGIMLKERLESFLSLKAGKISVDFAGIAYFAGPFFNNSFAALALVYGFDVIRAIQLENISDIGIMTYNASMENAEMVSKNDGLIGTARFPIENFTPIPQRRK